jgi:hypothetical protein
VRFLVALLLLYPPLQSPALTEIAGDIVFDDGITEGRTASVAVMVPGKPTSAPPVVEMMPTTFIIRQIAEPILVRGTVTGPRGEWGLKMVLLNGKDITDEPKHLATKDGRLQVVFTARAPAIVGTVTDDRERPIDAPSLVILFADDEAAWRPHGSRLQVTRSASRGAFTMKGLREGRYRLAAVPANARFTVAAPDMALLRRAKERATPVVLNPGDTRVVDVRLQRGDQ